MAYDAAAVLESLEPPAITVPRRVGFLWALLGLSAIFGSTKTYTGKILSEREFLPFRDRFIAANEGAIDEEDVGRLWKDYLDAIGIPARVVFRLPPLVMQEALESFFTYQLRASSGARGESRRSTSTSDLPRREPDEPRESRSREPGDTSPPELNSPSSSDTMDPELTSVPGGRPTTG